MFNSTIFEKFDFRAQKNAASNCSSDVLTTLQTGIDSGARVQLKLERDHTSYSCRISAINVVHGVFVIDRILPEIPSSRLIEGKKITLSVAHDGFDTKIESHYLEPLIENINAAHQLQIPEKLTIVKHNLCVDRILKDIDDTNLAPTHCPPDKLN